MSRKNLRDSQWVRSSFLLPRHATSLRDHKSKIFSTSSMKFTDTTLGGNFAINPAPQFTKTADLRTKNPMAKNSKGMGRIYSEKIDDNAQIIHMRFGVPTFTGLLTFYSSFYDYESSVLSKTGRSPGFLFNVGRVVGFVVTLPIQPIIMAGRLVKFLAGSQPSKFYYMKPTMYMYWQAATTTLNAILVADGTYPKVLANSRNSQDPTAKTSNMDNIDKYLSGDIISDEEVATKADFKIYHELLSDIFKEDGGVDLYAVANRAQRIATKTRRDAIKILEGASGTDMESIREAAIKYVAEVGSVTDPGHQLQMKEGLSSYIAAWQDLPIGSPKPDGGSNESLNMKDEQTWTQKVFEFFLAEIQDGGQFVSFKVNETGTASESFSNSVGQPELKNKINGMSGNARSKSFDFAAGRVSDGGVGKMVEGVISSAKDLAMGLATGIGVEGLAAAFGSAYVDIADRWEDSSANLPSMSYTMELRCPYDNPISRLINLWVPLSLILTAALPKAVGKSAYDSPFLVELYDKGKAQTRLGIIDSLSIERGVGNLGWNKERSPLGITVNFTVKDLSSIMYMPLNGSPGLFDDQSTYSDYMAVLGSMGLADQIYPVNRLKLNLTRMSREWKSWTSPAKWGSMLANNTTPGRVLAGFARATDR